MAEIGLLASIISVASAGAKTSLCLYQFADAVGIAGKGIRGVATEISLFCSVLKQLDSTLRRAKSARYSLSALMVANEILSECQRVFAEIRDIVDHLQQDDLASGQPTISLVSKVKWAFKRPRVLVLRSTLESMKITLLLMLTTLDFAQKIASRRVSTLATDLEDEGEEVLAESLLVTQQLMFENLLQAEELADREIRLTEETGLVETNQETRGGGVNNRPGGDSPRSPISRGPPQLTAILAARKPATQRSEFLNGFIHSPNSEDTDSTQQLGETPQVLPNSPIPPPLFIQDSHGTREASLGGLPPPRSKRASVWFTDVVFGGEFSPITRRQTWDGNAHTLEARRQFNGLLKEWIQSASTPSDANQESTDNSATPANKALKPPGTNTSFPPVIQTEEGLKYSRPGGMNLVKGDGGKMSFIGGQPQRPQEVFRAPGATNRSPPASPGILVPPVPPIPIPSNNLVVPLSSYQDEHFFMPGDPRNSGIRTTITPSLARSSVAATIYHNNAIVEPIPVQTGVRGRAAMVSVKPLPPLPNSGKGEQAAKDSKDTRDMPTNQSAFSVGSTFLSALKSQGDGE